MSKRDELIAERRQLEVEIGRMEGRIYGIQCELWEIDHGDEADLVPSLHR